MTEVEQIMGRLLEFSSEEDSADTAKDVASDSWNGQLRPGAVMFLKGYGTTVEVLAVHGSVAEVYGVDYKGPISVSRLEPISEAAEEDDEETIKDILGTDYLDEPEPENLASGDIERHGRWADVRIGNSVFCISYLTPVAVYISGRGLFRSSKGWSATTKRHIVKWAMENGYVEDGARWNDVERISEVMDQSELIDLFKKESSRVRWTSKEARQMNRVPAPAFWKSSDKDRVQIEPHVERR
jgi:hypothetical protein